MSTLAGEDCFFRNWRVEHGLAESEVIDIARDELGFLWVATPYGLNRFDGKTFKWFGKDKTAGSRDLERNYVNCLAAGADGDMWIGAHALVHYDAATEAFTKIEIPDSEIIQDVEVDHIHSRVWAGGNRGGLWCFDTNTFELISTHSLRDHITSRVPEIQCLQVEADGRILVGHRLGVARFDTSPDSYESVTERANQVVGLCAGPDGTIYFATWSSLLRLSPDGAATICDRRIGQIRRIDCGQDGRILIGLAQGVSVYDPVTDKISAMPTSKDGRPGTLVVDRICSLHADKFGLVWIGTKHHGLYLLDPRNQNFKTIVLQDSDGIALRSMAVTGLALDPKSESVYMSTAFHGLVRYDKKTKEIATWNREKRETTIGLLPSDKLSGVMIDGDGRVWTHAYPKGLETLTQPDGDLSKQSDPKLKVEMRAITRVAQTKDGRFWLNVLRKPIRVFDPAKNQMGRPRNAATGKQLDVNLATLCETRDGRMWIGGNRGLVELSRTKSDAEANTNTSNKFTVLPSAMPNGSENILAIREDKRSDGVLWIGTNIGLWRFDSHQSPTDDKHRAWKQVPLQTSRAGLPVVSLEQDSDGDIWAATSAGIFLYMPATGTRHYFDQRNGLKVSSYHPETSQSDGNTMFFGGVGGVTWFDASEVKDSLSRNGLRDMPEIVELLVNNDPVYPCHSNCRLEKALIRGGTVSLAPDDEVFSLRFQSLDFEPQDTERYRYMLKGFSQDWTLAAVGTDVATFTAVPPGEYQFILERIMDHRQPANHERITVPVKVRAHVWETAWFQWCLALASVLLVGGLISAWWISQRRRIEATTVRERNSELSSLNQQLEQLIVQKDDLMGIMAHDLRNPLAALSIGFELLQVQDKPGGSDDATLSLDTLSGSVDQMLDIIDRSLLNCREQLSPDNELKCELRVVDARSLVQSTVNDYSQVASAKNIQLVVETPEQECLVIADDGYARQVLANLLSNAVKFSHANSSVWVTVANHQPGTVQIQIRDEGLGLTDEDIKRCFGRFQKLSASPTGQEASSGLGLYNALKVTESMGGTLIVASAGKNQGATFTLTVQQPVVVDAKATSTVCPLDSSPYVPPTNGSVA